MQLPRAFAVVEHRDGHPLILCFHVDRTCAGIHEELHGRMADKMRDLVRHPDRLSEILLGAFVPERGTKQLIELSRLPEENLFVDADGGRHIIAPCQQCAKDASKA